MKQGRLLCERERFDNHYLYKGKDHGEACKEKEPNKVLKRLLISPIKEHISRGAGLRHDGGCSSTPRSGAR